MISFCLELPDLLNPAQVEVLRKWNGELRFLTNFKLRRISKKLLNTEMEKRRAPTLSNEKTKNKQEEMSVN